MRVVRFCMMFIMTIIVLSQSACFLPEEFEVNIDIHKDGSYTFKYDGKLAYVMALSAIAEGKFSKDDEKALKDLEKEMLESSPELKKFKYIGNGRYDIFVDKTGEKGEDYYFLSKDVAIFSIKNTNDETLQIKSFEMDRESLEQIQALNVKVEGTLSIAVDKNLKVIEHNAHKKSSNLYQWHIKKPDTAPRLVIKCK